MSLYDDASLIMFPSGYKEDKIYSLKANRWKWRFRPLQEQAPQQG
jgi:hypothetical protein